MEDMRSFAYLCPNCKKIVLAQRTRFALSAAAVRIECDCEKSELRAETDGMRFRLWVPCGLCGGTHEAVCRPEQLTEGPGLALACAGSKQFSCFIGPEETVRRHLEELELLAAKEKLQEGGITPTYKLIETQGPPHDRTFVAQVYAGDQGLARGTGRTKKEAESQAAKSTLARLGEFFGLGLTEEERAAKEKAAAQAKAEKAAARAAKEEAAAHAKAEKASERARIKAEKEAARLQKKQG